MDQQSFLCPGRDPSRVAQPKELLISVGTRSRGATRKGLAQPPLTTSLFLTPTLSFSIVSKAPIAPSQPPSPPHSSQRQICPHLPSQALPLPWAGSPARGRLLRSGVDRPGSQLQGAELSLVLLISLIPH